MYRRAILIACALACAPYSYAQLAPPSPGLRPALPDRAEQVLQRSQRLLDLRVPEPLRAASRGVPEVLTDAQIHFLAEDWTPSYRVTHSYASLRRHISTHFSEQGGPGLAPFYLAERFYDSEGRIAQVRFDTWQGEGFVPAWRSLYTYTGSLVAPEQVLHQWTDGQQWLDYERETPGEHE
jgi:hypothetical protein